MSIVVSYNRYVARPQRPGLCEKLIDRIYPERRLSCRRLFEPSVKLVRKAELLGHAHVTGTCRT